MESSFTSQHYLPTTPAAVGRVGRVGQGERSRRRGVYNLSSRVKGRRRIQWSLALVTDNSNYVTRDKRILILTLLGLCAMFYRDTCRNSLSTRGLSLHSPHPLYSPQLLADQFSSVLLYYTVIKWNVEWPL